MGASGVSEETTRKQTPLVVGIGTSDDVEALERFFSTVRAGGGVAFMVVQHDGSEGAGALAEQLGRLTDMPVVVAREGMRLEVDRVHAIPPGTLLGEGGVLVVASGRYESPVDALFGSLAEEVRESAVGVVLSGSGTHGTNGLRAIVERGGLTLAQRPETAKQPAMPKSAIDAGVVHHVLLPEQMAQRLIARVKGLVELHQWTVRGESAEIGGASVTIALPLADVAEAVPAKASDCEDTHGRRVLVVDDNVDMVETMRDALALGGHVVDVAFSGREGIEKARTFHPEVVLCDIGLPEMDGYEVARAFRADPELAHTKLVALSGYTHATDVARALKAGFDAHLAKPPTIAAILEQVAAPA
jgi:chemotaxis response regulator CheB